MQTCEHELAVVRNRILTMRAENARMQQECDHILDQHSHLRDEVSRGAPSPHPPCPKPATATRASPQTACSLIILPLEDGVV